MSVYPYSTYKVHIVTIAKRRIVLRFITQKVEI